MEMPAEEPPVDRRPVLLSAAQVAGIVVAHGLTTAAIIDGADYSERRVGPLPQYWAVVTLVPSLVWAAIVLGRAAAWRRASSFWLPGAAAVVAILAFIAATVLRFGPVDWPGVGFGMLVSSWILIGFATVVALVTRLVRSLRRRARGDAPRAELPHAEG